MILNEEGLKNTAEWESKGYDLPHYDRRAMVEETRKHPTWVHLGAGNLFRAFQANAAQKLLNKGVSKTGVIVAEGFDYEIAEKQYRPHDNYSILVTLKSDGSIEKTVIGSIAESCVMDSENPAEWGRMKEIFAAPSLQMVSFTITEKGYSLVNGKGEVMPAVENDFKMGPAKPQSYIGKVTALLYDRYQAGSLPIAMVSMDNCSHNGEKLLTAVKAYVEKWTEAGLVDNGFKDYIETSGKVSFPWTMIDKITPRPDKSVEEMLRKDGLEGLDPVVTSRNTYVAPFVNSEETEYLVVEDVFPNGRPHLEDAGIMFTDRETVNKVERMKVCTCLNPLHTAMAVLGCLLGYTKISDEMKDADIVGLIKGIGYQEGLPVVTNPGILDPKKFIDTVIDVRLVNPFMPDTPQRIATDTSQKLSIRYGETVKAYLASDKLNIKDLKRIPFVYAAWIRYLMGVNDNGEAFELSPDPLIPSLKPYVEGFKLGTVPSQEELKQTLLPLLKNKQIFNVDLEEAGLSDEVLQYFAEMLKGTGAIRSTLHKVAE
ncbi:MAG: mannitol dehydrogenase family protein [Solobacterium sp.]|jgi:fructuronate reductase|nr:mannitol dehydrogenase family protein [Solobacterium sp.]MCH4223250.1 mannitol dehydrogenase family protein [Solobacterium sp.]MCH4266067.1 mannitol dehydrogenase family protein [Solobacterium sp.]